MYPLQFEPGLAEALRRTDRVRRVRLQGIGNGRDDLRQNAKPTSCLGPRNVGRFERKKRGPRPLSFETTRVYAPRDCLDDALQTPPRNGPPRRGGALRERGNAWKR